MFSKIICLNQCQAFNKVVPSMLAGSLRFKYRVKIQAICFMVGDCAGKVGLDLNKDLQ